MYNSQYVEQMLEKGIKHKPIFTGENIDTQKLGEGSSGNDWRCT